MHQLVSVTSPHSMAPRERNAQPKPARELRRSSSGFRNEREPLAASHACGDRVIAEDNNREIITKQINKIAK
jgi:hypothetical protein